MRANPQARPAGAAEPGPLPAFAREWALFLDVDGTLLDIALHPRAVRVEPALLEALGRLQHLCDGRLALVSGRSIAELDALFAPLALPIAGQHGSERRRATREVLLERPSSGALAEARDALETLAKRNPGLLFEDKGLALAMHFRNAPHLEPLVERTLGEVAQSSAGEFGLQRGKMVLELVPHGKNKGSAIAEYMCEAPFAGRVPVFVGDDITDEHGFVLVNGLGGHSVKVGLGASAARFRLSGAVQVRAWLGAYADWLERTG
jgi:trehalose 6-phosphate phosphatase